jgi:gluconate:H+ symporter, GntP family
LNVSFYYIILALLLGVGAIVLLTLKFRLHAFFALLVACLVTGLVVGMPLSDIVQTAKDGFGNIMKSLGLIIALGTTLGVLLEQSGSTAVMAAYLLKKIGPRRAGLAISITGFIVGLPVFCDSGYVVLSGLVQPMARRTGFSVATMSVSLATGLLSVHCLIPPHPGAVAAAATLGVDLGKLMVAGIGVAIPAMLVGHWWARRASPKTPIVDPSWKPENSSAALGPSVIRSFLPVAVPVVLIGLKSLSITDRHTYNFFWATLMNLGDPVIALSIGVVLAFSAKKSWGKNALPTLLEESINKAGSILVIIGAGGAFGAVLAATKPGDHFAQMMSLGSLGLLFPFLCTSVLKTAQGSSTVAIITAASIIEPLLVPLGLATANGRLLCVLSMAAGSMVISHSNDAYFWVVLKFSGLDVKTMARFYSLATLWMGLVSLGMVYILSFILS